MISPANPHIKEIRKLRDHKERMETGLFYIEGLRIIAEAVQMNAKIEYLVVCPELLTSDYAHQLLKSPGVVSLPLYEVNEKTFTSFSLKEHPQGLGAVVHQEWSSLEQINPSTPLWIALDSIQDPGNLGTILRTSDSVGCAGVILLDQSTDPFDPTSIRASMGAIFSQKIIKTHLPELTAWKAEHPIPIIGTSGAAELDYHQVTFPNPCILLMGSERQGLLKTHLAICDMIVRIPMVGRSDSLNLAIATAIVLYEVFNQRR